LESDGQEDHARHDEEVQTMGWGSSVGMKIRTVLPSPGLKLSRVVVRIVHHPTATDPIGVIAETIGIGTVVETILRLTVLPEVSLRDRDERGETRGRSDV
jgi:hypothetical protein